MGLVTQSGLAGVVYLGGRQARPPCAPITPSPQNSVSSREKRGATKKRKAPQPPASIPMPVRGALAVGGGGRGRKLWLRCGRGQPVGLI